MTFLQHVKHTVQRYRLFREGDRVVVAVSGGADSVALLLALNELASEYALELTCAHLDHRLRGEEARADLMFVRQLAESLDIRCVTEEVDARRRARNSDMSVEMAARRVRYEFLCRVCRETEAQVIATGHTADDQAETVLMRVIRGTGTRGLGGIAPAAERDGVRIVRPLIESTRAELLSFLRGRKAAWREDASNLDRAFIRNRIRHEILPLLESRLNPAVRDALCRLADIMREDEAWLDALAEARLRDVLQAGNAVDVQSLAAMRPAVRRRVLVRWLVSLGADPGSIDFDTVERLDALLTDTDGTAETNITGNLVARRSYGALKLVESTQGTSRDFRVVVNIPGETIVDAVGIRILCKVAPGIVRPARATPGSIPAEASLNIESLRHHNLVVRNWRDADRIRPLGMDGSRKVQDVLVDAKVPRDQRACLPIFDCCGEVVWIPGYRVATGWEVPDDETPALQVRVTRL